MRGQRSTGVNRELAAGDPAADSPLDRLSAWQLVVLAVARCGGATRSIDTEDVAVAVHRLAPGRFSWRKHKDQINLEHVRVALSDAKKEKSGALLTGSGNAGWMLTAAGKAFADSVPESQAATGIDRRLSPDERRVRSRELLRVREHPAVMARLADPTHVPTVRDAEAVFRVDAYVVGIDRKRKIDRLINTVGDDPEIGPLVRDLAQMLLNVDQGG